MNNKENSIKKEDSSIPTVFSYEDTLIEKYPKIFEILLFDNTTKRNIIWASDLYKKYGFKFNDSINIVSIKNNKIIKPRSSKAKEIKIQRVRENAEVFTPSWMCNKQNNLIDENWFGRKNVFNSEQNELWEANTNKIIFNGKTWLDYIKDIRLEISCGEAPYLVSRYDTVTGNYIELKNRIGILDRKFRVLGENCSSKDEWIEKSYECLKSTYGYEWQGDSLFLARKNVLFTYIDYYYDKFNEYPQENVLNDAANIISWNIWQMDGIRCVIPNSCQVKKITQINLFGEEIIEESGCVGCVKGNIKKHNGIYSKIMDWESNKKITFVSLIKGLGL